MKPGPEKMYRKADFVKNPRGALLYNPPLVLPLSTAPGESLQFSKQINRI